MTKQKKRLLVLCIFLIAFSLFGCSQKNTDEQVHDTPEEAILNCLEANGIKTTKEGLADSLLDRFKLKGIHYSLLKGVQKTTDKQVNYVYFVGVVPKNDGNYICEKVTADFTLGSIDAVEDAEYTNYSEYIIPIGDLYIHVGKIHDPDYKPYFKGKQLHLDKDYIFFCKTKDANADIEIREQ